MKCVTYNIQYCTGRDGQVDPDRIAREVDGADIIALQEVECFWPRSGNIDQAGIFREHFSGYYSAYGPGVDIHNADAADPGQRRQFGNMLLSRYPLQYVRHHLLPKRGSIGPLSVQRSAVEATVVIGDLPLRLFSVHLTHLSTETRMPQIRRLLDINRNARHEGFPVDGSLDGMNWEDGVGDTRVAEHAILFGDFNSAPDSAEYREIVGPPSDYGGTIISPDGFVDAWQMVGGDTTRGATSEINGHPERIDYCFVSASLRHRLQACWVDDSAEGSDHLPVWLELDL